MIELNWYFWVLMFLQVLGLGIDIERHGEKKTGTHSFGLTLFSTTVAVVLIVLAISNGSIP